MDTLSKKLASFAAERELPYLDIQVFEGYEQRLHFLHGPADGCELLQMYSMSKAFTVTAAMILVQQGRLTLTDPVEKYFPEFAATSYIRDGNVLPNPNQMTVWNLFTMTSGLSYDVSTDAIREVSERLGERAVLQDYAPAFAKTPLTFPCGESFQYSLSHDLLAAIVEKVTGMCFADFVKQAIFDPLGMENATFYNYPEGLYRMYECDKDKNINPASHTNWLLPSPGYISGGAGLNCTITDYAKLVMALANGGVAANGYHLLTNEAVDAIRQPLLSRDFVRHDLVWLGDDYGYGLGVRVRTEDTDWGLMKGEFGWDGAAGSFWLADPNRKISLVMGMNILSWDRKYIGIHMQIVEMIYRELFN